MRLPAHHPGWAALTVALLSIQTAAVRADDWPQFRGPGGTGVSADTGVATTWTAAEHILWRAALPGPGSSSPIVVGDRVYVTCYTGYGVQRESPGNMADLKRHLICLNRADGKILWDTAVDAVQPEDRYAGMITEHGYASATPASDGERIYVFLGKSGVAAFDLKGAKLWQTSVGTSSSNRRWGSGTSPVLCKNLVIVNAADEGRAVCALDKKTGKLVWKAEAAGTELSYSTPAVAVLPGGRADVVVPVPGEVWGINAETGKLRWYATVPIEGNVCPSPILSGDIAYLFGGFTSRASCAVRMGGEGDVTRTHVVWTSEASSYVPTPSLYKGRLFWVTDQGWAMCSDAANGKLLWRERLPVRSGQSPVYASVTLADGKVFAVTRFGGTFVLGAGDKFE